MRWDNVKFSSNFLFVDLFPLEELHNLKEINVNKTQHDKNIKKYTSADKIREIK